MSFIDDTLREHSRFHAAWPAVAAARIISPRRIYPNNRSKRDDGSYSTFYQRHARMPVVSKTARQWEELKLLQYGWSHVQGSYASWKVLESPGISLSCFQGPGKSLNHYMVLESPGNVVEFDMRSLKKSTWKNSFLNSYTLTKLRLLTCSWMACCSSSRATDGSASSETRYTYCNIIL
jgi:hypothetical protein